MTELKPCPFCGNVAVKEYHGATNTSPPVIVCSKCHARGPVFDVRQVYDEQTRIALWNFRIGKGLVRPKPEPRYDKAYFDFVENLDRHG